MRFAWNQIETSAKVGAVMKTHVTSLPNKLLWTLVQFLSVNQDTFVSLS